MFREKSDSGLNSDGRFAYLYIHVNIHIIYKHIPKIYVCKSDGLRSIFFKFSVSIGRTDVAKVEEVVLCDFEIETPMLRLGQKKCTSMFTQDKSI